MEEKSCSICKDKIDEFKKALEVAQNDDSISQEDLVEITHKL